VTSWIPSEPDSYYQCCASAAGCRISKHVCISDDCAVCMFSHAQCGTRCLQGEHTVSAIGVRLLLPVLRHSCSVALFKHAQHSKHAHTSLRNHTVSEGSSLSAWLAPRNVALPVYSQIILGVTYCQPASPFKAEYWAQLVVLRGTL
jgi:hypothetical protein